MAEFTGWYGSFKQTPVESVRMLRWLEGEKENL